MDSNRPSVVWPNGTKPNLGDTTTSKSVGRIGRAVHIWEACSGCGFERWIKRNTSGVLCKGCALRNHSFGEDNRRWNSTRRTVTKSGIRVYIGEGHPYFCMAHRCALGFAILEHRLVMAEHLGRPLEKYEVVHHIDGNNQNNDLANLLLLSAQAHHAAFTLLQTQINKLNKEVSSLRSRVTLLETENTLLRSQFSTEGIVNPDLAGDHVPPGKSRDFTLPILSNEQDKEKVHPLGKPWDKGASQELIQAALTQWRCENLPKRGTLNSDEESEHGNLVLTPDNGRDIVSGKCVETIQEALSEKSESDEIVHPSRKLGDYDA